MGIYERKTIDKMNMHLPKPIQLLWQALLLEILLRDKQAQVKQGQGQVCPDFGGLPKILPRGLLPHSNRNIKFLEIRVTKHVKLHIVPLLAIEKTEFRCDWMGLFFHQLQFPDDFVSNDRTK
eukprot:m.102034 g.102034  ORF g.102034 m.102034 type:complete len:122 (-) comp13757_c0_seq16:847-1212(-)